MRTIEYLFADANFFERVIQLFGIGGEFLELGVCACKFRYAVKVVAHALYLIDKALGEDNENEINVVFGRSFALI